MQDAPAKAPFKIVEIEINSHCNLACSYCPNREYERIEKGLMSLKEYELILEQLVGCGFDGRLSHEFYGEPTLHPHYREIIAMTRKALPHVRIELYTNGTRIDLPYFKDLVEAGLDEFIVTKHIGQETILFEKTLKELTDEEKKLVTFKDHSQIYKTNRAGSLPDVGGDKQPLLPCFIPSFLVCITVKGQVLPCFEDFFQHHEMGNVFETPLMEIWHSKKFTDFREDLKKGLRHKHKACENCNRIQTLIPTDEQIKKTKELEKHEL